MKSKLQLIINGRPVLLPIQLSEEQIRQLTSAINIDEVLTGWEEPQIGQIGYFENEFNEVSEFEVTEETLEFAQKLYESDNYFSTKETAENTVRADNVLRRIRHFAISHRATDTVMADGGYTITYNYELGCLEIGATGNWLALGDMVFDTEEIARKAMNKYAADLIWYFTEGKAMM
jgi:hypothetical protein